MRLDLSDLPGMRATVMGLGLHGGGVASALFLARHGASVTVTDLRSEEQLRVSLDALAGYAFRFVLGRHVESDFSDPDIVVKNPAVRADSPFLRLARRIETDLSIFLSICTNPVLAVTGTKGKSTTATALHDAVKSAASEARLGGNITVSPLTFADELLAGNGKTPVVLELSSWQLADLKGKGVLKPRVAVVTNILPDHLNRYPSMESYVDDKRIIYAEQGKEDFTVCNFDDAYGKAFAAETHARARFFSAAGPLPQPFEGAWLDSSGEGFVRRAGSTESLLPEKLALPGTHNRVNLLSAGLAATLFGTPIAAVREALSRFRGIPHRLELVSDDGGIRVYNDSAATIPEATVAAVNSFDRPVILITGGTDKNLDFTVFRDFKILPAQAYLLAGSAAVKIAEALSARGVPCHGPYHSLGDAVTAALDTAAPDDVVLFSPASTSFEMFANEFDRGDRFRSLVRSRG